MKITVVLCTYNRSAMLRTCLQSLAGSSVPQSVEWEVLVVDNNSTDDTRDVIEDFCKRHPVRFRHLFEPRQGKSFALNAGIQNATGDILAFTDDDVVVEPDWLEKLTGGLQYGKWAGAAGKIILEWPAELPDWLHTSGPFSRHPFPGFDKGDTAKELVGPPFGANMAFRKEVFEKYGGFRTDLGPNPGNEIRAEDLEFGRKVIGGGECLWYEPKAIVHHPVPAHRIDKNFFLKWRFDYGRGDAREAPIKPARHVCSLIAWTFRWAIAIDRRTRFFRKVVVWEKMGALIEFKRQFLAARSLPVKSPNKEWKQTTTATGLLNGRHDEKLHMP